MCKYDLLHGGHFMPITIFTRSVSGYNRQQVDSYIADMNRAFVKTRNDYEKKIESLEAEISGLKLELEKTKTEASFTEPILTVDEIDNDITEKSRRYDELSHQVGEILMNANAEASVIMRQADEKVRAALTGTMSTLRTEITSLITKLNELLESADAELAVDDGDGAEG